jgi:hypothetical protein
MVKSDAELDDDPENERYAFSEIVELRRLFTSVTGQTSKMMLYFIS